MNIIERDVEIMNKKRHYHIKERVCRHCGDCVGWMSSETWARHSQFCVQCLNKEVAADYQPRCNQQRKARKHDH